MAVSESGRVDAVPPMPETANRRPYDEERLPGYLEGNRDWAAANNEAVGWLADNHAAIRSALSPAATPTCQQSLQVANCCHCSRIIDTREKADGGDDWGHQLSDKRWVCSPECFDAVADPAATPVSEADSP